MAFLDEAGVSELWKKAKARMLQKLGGTAASTTYDIKLTNSAGTDTSTLTLPAATTGAAGLMTAADKAKLNGIADGATKTTDTNTTYSISKSGSTITLTGSDGKTSTVTDSNTWTALKGATSSAAGTAGYAPAPAAGAANRYLRSDGTWTVPPNDNTKYDVFKPQTSSSAGTAGLVPGPPASDDDMWLSTSGWGQISTGDVFDTAGSKTLQSMLDAIVSANNATVTVTAFDGTTTTFTANQGTAVTVGKAMSTAQQNAVNSGITSAKVSTYDGYASQISGKQATLTSAQQSAVNSGITSSKVSTYDGYASQISAKAPTASPAFTGTPTAPTPQAGTNNTQVATTAFVQQLADNTLAAAQTGAAHFRGILKFDSNGEATNWLDLFFDFQKGMYAVCDGSGTYAGEHVEAGDMVFAIRDSEDKDDSGNAYPNQSKVSSANIKPWFSIVQNNITAMTVAQVDAACA